MTEITRKVDALKLIKGGMLKLKDCNERHRRDRDIVLEAVKRDGREIEDAFLDEMETSENVKADMTFLMEAIQVAQLRTSKAVDAFSGIIHIYAQEKSGYIKHNFKGLSESERKKMVKSFETELKTALAVEYAKQNPDKVIQSAKVETPKPKPAPKKVTEKDEFNK